MILIVNKPLVCALSCHLNISLKNKYSLKENNIYDIEKPARFQLEDSYLYVCGLYVF